MTINAKTTIGAIIKDKLEAIDVLISLSPHFKKLKNPVVRKILAPRVTVAEAAVIGNCNVQAILDNLAQIGFSIEESHAVEKGTPASSIVAENDIDLAASIDVRPDLAGGADPFNRIMNKLSGVAPGKTLLLINSFEPAPLIRILTGKGYSVSVSKNQPGIVFTYITKIQESPTPEGSLDKQFSDPDLFDNVLKHYNLKFTEIDVRQLEMPKPMIAILDELDHLDKGEALYVRHKKVPLFLFPELKDRGFSYVYKQAESEVILIIYHN